MKILITSNAWLVLLEAFLLNSINQMYFNSKKTIEFMPAHLLCSDMLAWSQKFNN